MESEKGKKKQRIRDLETVLEEVLDILRNYLKVNDACYLTVSDRDYMVRMCEEVLKRKLL